MNTHIEIVIAQLRQEIEARTDALSALERLRGQPVSVIEAKALPAPKPAQIDLEEAIAAAEKPADKPARTQKVDIDRLRELHAQGLDDGKIGAHFGVTNGAITLWRKKLGLHANSKGGRKAAPPSATAGVERVNSAATIVSWLRQRDTIIAEVEAGKTWKVNGRDVIDRAGLLTMANRKREIAKLPPFGWEHG